jgi:hypothetical protein
MKTILTDIYNRLASLTLGLWILCGVMLLMAAGSFLQGTESNINEVALLDWLLEVPVRESWWLWASIVLLAALALNTIICSAESLRMKWQKGFFVVRLAPQLIHLSFLFIMIAHLQTAYGGFKQVIQAEPGSLITFPDGSNIIFTDFAATYGKMGMPTAFSAALEIRRGADAEAAVISPNHPLFHLGYGIYIKDIAPPPMKVALIEIHREPGALMALTGGMIFTVANLALLVKRREKTV